MSQAAAPHPPAVDPAHQADEMISPTQADATALADAIRRTAHQLADRRRNSPKFGAQVDELLARGGKHAEELGYPDVAEALRDKS